MKILIVEPSKELRQLLNLVIKNYLSKIRVKSKIFFSSELDHSIEIVKKEKIDLIISEENLINSSGGDLFQYVYKNSPETYFLTSTVKDILKNEKYSKFLSNPKKYNQLGKPYNLEILKNRIEEILKKEIKNFHNINIALIYNKEKILNKLNFYINNNGNFIKVHKIDNNSDQVYYLDDKSLTVYVDFLYQSIKDNKIIKSQEINEILTKIPISQSSKGIAEGHIQSTIQLLKGLNINKDILKKLQETEEFLGAHVKLALYISLYLLEKLDWASRHNIEKMTKASIIHDLYIQKDETNPKHVFDALNLVNECFDCNDLSKIILQHHEKPNGTGFPKGLSGSNIFSLSAVFIIAHDLSEVLWHKQNIQKWYKDKIAYYNNGVFNKAYHQLNNLIAEFN